MLLTICKVFGWTLSNPPNLTVIISKRNWALVLSGPNPNSLNSYGTKIKKEDSFVLP